MHQSRLIIHLTQFIICALIFSHPVVSHADNITQIIKADRPETSELMEYQSDLIVLVHLDQHIRKWDTGQSLPSGQRFINAEQVLHIQSKLKGHAPSPTLLLTTGVEPLPDPQSPLNTQYTGPLADGDYVLFLKHFRDPNHFILSGGFCAVYPVVFGKLIALDDGFKEFGGKTIPELRQLLHSE
jgi:hypothetical protein